MPDDSVSIRVARSAIESTNLEQTDYPVALSLLAIATQIKELKDTIESIGMTVPIAAEAVTSALGKVLPAIVNDVQEVKASLAGINASLDKS
jgi:copper chaperone CopZ